MYSVIYYTSAHSDMTWIEETPPTCESEGVIGHYHCSVCEKNFVYVDTFNGIPLSVGYFEEIDSVVIEAEHKDKIDGNNGACTVCGDPITESEGIVYSLSTDGSYAEVIDYTGTAKRIKIADTYEGVPVTTIGVAAFENKSITSVIIPDSVRIIESYAFLSCAALKSITIPDSVTTINAYAFSGCSSIANVNFGENSELEIIEHDAFSSCTNLTSVTIPNFVTKIESAAFQECGKLSSLTIGNSVESIGSRAFAGCNLSSVTIPDNVKNIGVGAFSKSSSFIYNDTRHTPEQIEGSVIYVDKWAVGLVDNPTSVAFREGTVGIADRAFEHTNIVGLSQPSKLRTVVIPNSVKYIGNEAFSGCTNLRSVTIGNSVVSIGDSAFEDCTILTSIKIPESVASIGDSAFQNCTYLTIYCETESEPSGWIYSWNYSNCPVVWGYKESN